jgi:hypothetical protein
MGKDAAPEALHLAASLARRVQVLDVVKHLDAASKLAG